MDSIQKKLSRKRFIPGYAFMVCVLAAIVAGWAFQRITAFLFIGFGSGIFVAALLQLIFFRKRNHQVAEDEKPAG